ncbi:PREDICTED: uncharacterized protein LOC108357257, partial [Rhagoletis zephyria]|uniref:uncharacterized protein LOC108357257 n=1 Tax=Rhagoletis zephyria TaxID=28612 RepID=UPI0008117770
MLVSIYKAFLRLSFIPKGWTLAKVVFIPKGGGPSHVKPSDFRPISLTSFFQKVLERQLDVKIRTEIDLSKLSSCQHAYWKGRSVDTALHGIVSTIEKALALKESALGVFLDIE